MKIFAPSLLVGAAAAASPFQHVLQGPKQISETWSKSLRTLQESFDSLSREARAVWDEVTMMFPDAMDQLSFFSSPKKHTKRPDHHWDYIVKGADIQDMWVENKNGGKEREIDGKLETYNLRAKKVDPSKLGIDSGVKQYSGYLDDNENDKHLFYCEFLLGEEGFYTDPMT